MGSGDPPCPLLVPPTKLPRKHQLCPLASPSLCFSTFVGIYSAARLLPHNFGVRLADAGACRSDGRKGLVARPAQAVSSSAQNAKLRESCHSIVQADFFGDFTVFNAQHRCSSEPHFFPGSCWKRTHKKIIEGRTHVCTAAFPTSNNVITLSDQVSRPPEIKVRETLHEIRA